MTGKGSEEVGRWQFTLILGATLTVDFDAEEEPLEFRVSAVERGSVRSGISAYALEALCREVRVISNLLLEEGGFMRLKGQYGIRCERLYL